jgi:signal transduction histidine kinase
MMPNAPILVVDDEPLNLAALDQILSPSYALVFANNGADGIAAARKHGPELILLDIQMPGLDGYEVCRTLKQEEGLAHIPVIFLSAFTDARSKVLAFEVGGSDYVPKPFSADEVLARIKTHLKVLGAERQQRESYERLKAAEALRDNLVHMMVHDLRSPLMAMMASLEVLEEESGARLPPRSLATLGKARSATRRMAQMVTTVLDLSKLEAGQMALKLQPCDLADLLQEVVDTHRELAGARRLVLEVPAPVSVKADRDLLFRVFQNLISNAIKFTPEAKEIRIHAEEAEGWAQIRFIDQGPGILPQDRDRIFQKFGQVGGNGQPGWASTGLGLPFCKLAVEAHQGTLGLDSAAGAGACFLLRLPTRPRSVQRRP